MKVRAAIAGPAVKVRLTAGALILLGVVGVSACSSGSTPSSVFTPSGGSVSATVSATVTSTSTSTSSTSASTSATASTSASASASTPPPTSSPTPSPSPTPTPTTSYPTAAPVTGGGGTAGLQDGLLFALGGVVILAGLGSIAYRRKLNRSR